ncbi:MAG TPA: NUDIX hydrolase [Rhizomicrobium sp.]|nr:NUDIX hydrolase [Rhizomicrobium sp.]
MTGAPRGSLIQVAALCWRSSPKLEILLVTSLRTRRWILPKGWPQDGMSLAQSAAAEALEEAGVTGTVAAEPIGRYHYLKEKNGSALPCVVEVFSLFVTGRHASWAEQGARQILWLPAERAAAKVAETGLRRILTGFARARKAA